MEKMLIIISKTIIYLSLLEYFKTGISANIILYLKLILFILFPRETIY